MSLNWRLADVPRTRQFIAKAKGGMRGLGDNGDIGGGFGDVFDDYGNYVDYGGTTFDQADVFMPYDETVMLEQGSTTYDPFEQYGETSGDIYWPSQDPEWAWGAPDFNYNDVPPISGSGGTVTSEGVSASWPAGGGLSMPSWANLTDLLKVGTQVYTQVQQQEINRELAERGVIPRTMYPQTMLPGVPRTTTGTQPMVWNPATNRYEPASGAAAGQLIPGVSNTMLIAGAAGIAALLLLGGTKGKRT